MKKKGFTLIEIIIVVGLIAFIGTVSFFGIRLINKNIKIKKLNEITDKAIKAAEVYLETNKDAYNQLYKEKNGVVVPLNILLDEGLLTLENTDLKKSDIEGEYVVTFLEQGGEDTSECVDIRTETSWYEGSSAPIYICTDSDGNSSLAVIDPEDYNNLTHVTKEPYYFKGAYPNNYIWYNTNTYRIIKVDRDDSLTLSIGKGGDTYFTKGFNKYITKGTYAIYNLQYNTGASDGWLGYVGSNDFAIKLDVCYKIKSGTGDINKPFILDDSECN